MPMVETSVAVATPSMTAARITNGKAIAGIRDQEGPADLARCRAPHMGQILRPVAPPDHTTQRQAEHHAREQPAGKEGGDRHAGDRANGDQDQARRDGLRLCAGRGEERDEVTGLAPRSFISGNSTGATAAMSAAFEPEMPDTRYMAPTST